MLTVQKGCARLLRARQHSEVCRYSTEYTGEILPLVGLHPSERKETIHVWTNVEFWKLETLTVYMCP